MRFRALCRLLGIWGGLAGIAAGCQSAREVYEIVHPEQRQIQWQDPESLPPAPLPSTTPPRTVSRPTNGEGNRVLSLDECIRIALENAQVVRVLTGLSVAPSGQTIYNTAIVNTNIDQERGRFDPTLSVNNTVAQDETPIGVFDPLPPSVRIAGTKSELYDFDAGLTKVNPLGGTSAVRVLSARSFVQPGVFPLNAQQNYFTELSYTQPLLRGAGLDANLAPILIARIDTDRSFFQFKDSMQEMVRGVIDAYWSLVAARTARWAREQQVEQAQFAYDRAVARMQRQLIDIGDVSQSRLALANFRSDLIASKSLVLQREAALLGMMGLSPTEGGEVIPTTPPRREQTDFQWEELVSLGERFRPDIIELKLIIEADEQQLNIAENNALPSLDAVALYRWDGLRGVTPTGETIGTSGNQFNDWTMGINFSVPLGLRQARAAERQQELIIVRDRANLRQGLLDAVNSLALNVRNLDQYFEQFEAYSETRTAARDNLLQQSSEYLNDRVILLNLLQAITDWGNSVSAQAQSLAQYNTELANLERATGTILEAHGIRFMEERYEFAGPCCCTDRCYPGALPPTNNRDRYPQGDRPAEESFDLTNPVKRGSRIVPPDPATLEKPPLPETDEMQLTPETDEVPTAPVIDFRKSQLPPMPE